MEVVSFDLVQERIRNYLLTKFPAARRNHVDSETALFEGGILDSLGVLDVVSFLEAEFSIAINDDELVPENFHNVRTLAAFVQTKLASAH